MPRETYVIRDGQLVPKHLAKPLPGKSWNIMSDIEPFVSPIDNQVVGGRRQKREHMKLHGVIDVGNDMGSQKARDIPPGLKQTVADVLYGR
jgi:hypothetical protein